MTDKVARRGLTVVYCESFNNEHSLCHGTADELVGGDLTNSFTVIPNVTSDPSVAVFYLMWHCNNLCMEQVWIK